MRSKVLLLAVGFGTTALLLAPSAARAASEAEAAPTYNEDIAPILNQRCVICHRPGTVAPMSLVSYKQTRPWARAIKEKVRTRVMPPWFADPRFGTFRNERRLTQEQIDTVVAWADAGAPEGEGDAPVAPEFPEGWMHPSGRAPDLVVEMPIEFPVPAEGELPNFRLYQADAFDEDHFAEALQVLPSNFLVVHHSTPVIGDLPFGTELGVGEAWPGGPIVSNVPVPIEADTEFDNGVDIDVEAGLEAQRDREQREVFATGRPRSEKLLNYVPGGGFTQYGPGVAKRLPADRHLIWGLHYQPSGRPEVDRHKLGIWDQKGGGLTHELITRRVGQTHIAERTELVATAEYGIRDGAGNPGPLIPVIPPRVDDWSLTGITAFQEDVTLYIVWPHMHLRGKDMTFVVTYPDGREEVVLHVPNYDFNWQLQYELDPPIKLPAGSTIKTVGHFDNSVKNRYNPAPDREVYWAEQSWDEMFNGWMDYAIDGKELQLEQKPSTEN